LPHNFEKQTFYSIKPPDYVTAFAETKDGKVIILKQYRPVVEDYTFELPSGHMEKGETPEQAMIRELKEETNCQGKNAILLGEIIPDAGRLENRLWAFYINDLEIKQPQVLDKNDGIDVYYVSHKELFEMITEGQLNQALDLSVIGLAIFKRYLKLQFIEGC